MKKKKGNKKEPASEVSDAQDVAGWLWHYE